MSIDASDNVTWNESIGDRVVLNHIPRNATPRFFEYRDNDDDLSNEVYLLAETGAVVVDNPGPNATIREFCNVGNHPGNPALPLGGYLFEYDRNKMPVQAYTVLQGFYVPYQTPYLQNSHGGPDWWYPRLGSYRLTGQVANTLQGISGLGNYHGTSMVKGVMLEDSQYNPVEHLVAGTMGGYVLAVPVPAPGQPADPNPYWSQDLGWYVTALDAGDLDGDGLDEVVAGSLVDDGTFDDWNAPQDLLKNRGSLVILTASSPGVWSSGHLYGDDLVGPVGSGLGAVTAVKVDNVDAEDYPEIWATDAIGHIYLFVQSGGGWTTRYRSEVLPCNPGIFQNLYPVKGADGKTSKLLVVSSGYLMAFAVKPDNV